MTGTIGAARFCTPHILPQTGKRRFRATAGL